MRRLAPVALALLAAIGLVTAAAPGSTARAAQPYTMETVATYDVSPESGTVDVTVAVTFTNTTPDPAGRYSLFRAVPIPVQDGATAPAARDGSGALTATLGTSGAGRVVTVALRTPLRYGKAASFTVSYRLADGANPEVRIRTSAVILPVWGYGTSGSVSVMLPAGFTVATVGDALTSSAVNGRTVLSSGPIADPPGWLALLTATRAAGYETLRRSIPLKGGTMDLQVRAWTDDAAWGTRTLDLLARALPVLQGAIGLPYTALGPMVITESLPVGANELAEPVAGSQEIRIAFDAAPFTILHQAAHIWLGSALAGERWIREGIASESAARAAQQLGLAVPYDPARESATRSASAVPLDAWTERSGTGPVTPSDAAEDAYGYAASWDVVNRIVAVVGQDGLQQVLARVAAGQGAYDPGSPDTGTGQAVVSLLPLTSERFLDQLEQLSDSGLSGLFAENVLTTAEQSLLPQRTAARSDYAALTIAAGDWGVPQPIRGLMADWRFAEARVEMADASAWLPKRDAFVADLGAAGLSGPDRLVSLWRSNGADERTQSELSAESAFVAAYRDADERIARNPNPVQRLGLAGASAPRALLARAAGVFAGGDLTAAADEVARAVAADRDAQATGVVRLAIGVAVLAVLAAATSILLRRWRMRAARGRSHGG